MRTRFYRWVSGTKDDGDRLQNPPVPVKPSYFMMSYLHLRLIHIPPSLLHAMRTHFYRWMLGTEDDGGGLQWDFISR